MNLKLLVFCALLAVGAVVWPTRVLAQFPVTDTAVLEAQESDSLQEWVRFGMEYPLEVNENINSNMETWVYTPHELANSDQEVANSTQELQLSLEEKEATTGPRGMSTLARTAESYIPLNWEQTLALMQESGGGLGGLAEQIRKSASKLDESYFADVDPALKAELDREMQGAAAGVAMNATVYDASKTRQERLDEMADAIEEAEDAKAIWDLQARVSIENGMLLNELIRLQSMNAMVANQRRINAQQTTQESFSLTSAKY